MKLSLKDADKLKAEYSWQMRDAPLALSRANCDLADSLFVLVS